MLLLDTNVVSELRKVRAGKADPNVAKWAQNTNTNDLYISVITLQELEIGVLWMLRRDEMQGQLLRRWLDAHVLPAFSGRILSIDTQIAQCAAALHAPNPNSLPIRDGLIAATALIHNMCGVTRNVRDFEASGVAIINPWKSENLS